MKAFRRKTARAAKPDPASRAREPSSQPLTLGAHALVSLATIAVFARALPYPLQRSWDDGRFIVDNPQLRSVSLATLREFFGAPQFEAYHPLHLLSYWLDVPLAGPDPFTLHAVSLLLWVAAANVWLRAYAGLGLSAPAAVLATLACALHPVQVEAVSWASGRKDVLALLFAGLSVLLHLRAGPGRRRYAWLSTFMFVLAALSKTTVLPLPAVLVIADVLLRGRSWRAALQAQAGALLFAAALGAGVIAIWSGHEMIRETAGGVAGLPARVAATLLHQLATALWPSANAPMYSTVAVAHPSPLAWALLAGLLVLGFRLRGRAPRARFTLAAFALLLLPVSNAVPMYFPYQDRYLSLPLIALGFGLGAFVDALRAEAGRGVWPVAAGALLVAALGLRCVQYQGEWASELRLWGHAASTQPDAYYARMKLGEVRRKAGDLYGAIRAYQALIAIDPQRKVGHAALLASVAQRDERLHAIAPSLADRYAEQYYGALDDPKALRELARRMLLSGYVRAIELPLARSLQLDRLPDNALERAAAVHFGEGRPSLGWFFLRQMQKPTENPELSAAGERARAQQAFSPL